MVQGLAKHQLHFLLERQVQRARTGVQVAQLGRWRVGYAMLLAVLHQACKQGGRALQLGDAVVCQGVQQIGRLKLAAHL